jgi:hypothetical protein
MIDQRKTSISLQVAATKFIPPIFGARQEKLTESLINFFIVNWATFECYRRVRFHARKFRHHIERLRIALRAIQPVDTIRKVCSQTP